MASHHRKETLPPPPSLQTEAGCLRGEMRAGLLLSPAGGPQGWVSQLLVSRGLAVH